MKIGIVIQARLNSTRFPNKVLAQLKEQQTLIEVIIARAKQVSGVQKVIVATSDSASDDLLVDFLDTKTQVSVIRGSENDVLSRYLKAAEAFELSQIVRLTADNPCIDPTMIDMAISQHLNAGADYTYTSGYPLGTNLEIVSREALIIAAKDGNSKADREHVTFFIRQQPQRFKLQHLEAALPTEVATLRLTLDTPTDYLMLRVLFDYLAAYHLSFTMNDVVQLWRDKPYIFDINKNIVQKKVFPNEATELQAAAEWLQQQELHRAAAFLRKATNS